jgi:hypothetical protein
MNEKDFLATLIAYLEFEEKFEVLELIEDCELTFNYTNEFASKSYQFRAYVDLRVPIVKMKKLKEHTKDLTRLCKDIFIEDKKYALYGVDIKPMMLKVTKNESNRDSNKTEELFEKKLEFYVSENQKTKNKIKICEKSVQCIAISITGDNGRASYKSGYDLVKFFNQFGFYDIYEQGFPPRKQYSIDKVTELNLMGRINEVIKAFLDPRDFIDTDYDIAKLVEYINKFLFFDYLVLENKQYEYELIEFANNRVIDKQLVALEPDITENSSTEKRKLNLFFSYSHFDENLRNELEKHLIMLKHNGLIETWYDRVIDAGTELDIAIDSNLKNADIILLLVSVDFLASQYCFNIEMNKALDMHKSSKAVVIPVILRDCDWHNAPFSKLMAVPTDGKSITTWADRDTAFLNVTKSIENVATKLIAKL